MKERIDILKWNQQLLAAGVDAALATVVRVQGSSYRRPGARMLIGANGQITGGVSGGCLERDVILRAGGVMASGHAALVRYDTTLDEEGGGYSLGCGGVIDILIEPLRTASGTQLIDWLKMSVAQPVAMATVISKHHPAAGVGNRLVVLESGEIEGVISNQTAVIAIESAARTVLMSDRSQFIQCPSEQGSMDLFIESLKPPLKLFVFGAGNDAVPLVRFAKSLGWHVTVVDVRSSQIDPGRVWEIDQHIRCSISDVRDRVAVDPSAAVVVMTHHVLHDADLIEWLSQRPLRYLGLLGPRHRAERILGVAAVEGLRSPVGLDLGADNPEEVALAIVSEITAVMHGRSGKPLSEHAGPIHAGPIHGGPIHAGNEYSKIEAWTGPARPGSVGQCSIEERTCAVAGS